MESLSVREVEEALSSYSENPKGCILYITEDSEGFVVHFQKVFRIYPYRIEGLKTSQELEETLGQYLAEFHPCGESQKKFGERIWVNPQELDMEEIRIYGGSIMRLCFDWDTKIFVYTKG